jgi:CRISPR/Cas system-associated exonuclease Cas4 (RecB family)
MKNYFDKYRVRPELAGKMPPELKLEGFKGTFYGATREEMERLNRWRSYRKSDLQYTDPKTGDVLYSVIDDLLFGYDGLFVVIDNKSRSSAPKPETIDMYRHQIGVYNLCLNACGYKTANYGFLNFVWPKEMSEGCIVDFETQAVRVDCDDEATIKLFNGAVDCINSETPPEENPKCDYCGYSEKLCGFVSENFLDCKVRK